MFRYPHRSEYYPSDTIQSYGHIITIITPLLTLVCVMCIISSQLLYLSTAQAENTNQLIAIPGTLSPLLKNSRFIAHADTQQPIWLSLGLRPRNSAALQQALQAVINPVGHQPRLALNTDEIIRRFSPTPASYTTLIRWLQAAGFHTIHTYRHRLLLDFEGTIGQAQRYFHLQINKYKAPDGTFYYSNNRAPLLPQAVASQVISINGLNNATSWTHTALEQKSQQSSNNHSCRANNTKSATGASGSSAAATASLADLYGTHYTGVGQTIALFELGRPAISDLHSYVACTGQKETMLEQIDAPTPESAFMPVSYAATIDAEAILGSVPQLQRLKIYSTTNNEKSYLDQWGQIVQDNPAVVSTSWGLCEQLAPAQLIQQEALFFQLAALQGQSIIAASSISCPIISSPATASQPAVSDPASQPFVTGVGATALIFDASHSTHDGLQTAGRPDPASTELLTTGGISQLWAMPAWQHIQGIPDQAASQLPQVCPRTSTEHYCREVPDVALNTDARHSFWAYCSEGCASNHPWLSINGSALAAPLWAAFVTLSNQLSQQHGGGNLGFINPLLYQLANNPVSYASSFYDIIATDDHKPASPGIGYDLTSGLGEYRAQHLAEELLKLIQPVSK
ncbi:S53 family peptidase [Dictyobacter formicarum]|uniref:Pseudomonapepsin n=1 Tax=Dictyobacter formicarum TaxID=2778368 RepID=A0ABQ3VQ18_9CHLR|nr:protease pro-enzyme activation domain-containing protein [Dictyobacter formicarum]GHO87952.1 pseudomonapepsin [Dictyobacter formicarum]